jgi:hypothetical protein
MWEKIRIDDIFYVTYCRPSSVVLLLFRFENPKKRKHEEICRQNRFFPPFDGKEGKTRHGVKQPP